MRLKDVVTRLVIDSRKLTEYALDPDNPIGAAKALMFQERLGYTKDNYELLLQQILDRALDAEATPTQADEHGQRYRVDLEIVGLQNQGEIVRTGWIVEPESDFARLVTLYVRKRS
ncbi:hypothetical protein IQ230_13300 [Gloeocapsopsis crepidinum LEGE 06123]|uniref:DUF6883 domain-containing protein n=1 Tax=Gloeocapsopsis crepidinum LEGE 06123 TaxID=588587 RepID=A0ABR9USN9_9CHRO|nr:DUF6883 domain-containing protein [Gloeocapsopsis crepidinum]MBE9191310.1 hypothetical protein [Gloeocapsopsis crepidinum LEGE 06123]